MSAEWLDQPKSCMHEGKNDALVGLWGKRQEGIALWPVSVVPVTQLVCVAVKRHFNRLFFQQKQRNMSAQTEVPLTHTLKSRHWKKSF